jgi:TonB family protein
MRYIRILMAHQPTLLPDPSEHSGRKEEPTGPAARPSEWGDEGSDLHLAELTATLASHGGGTHSADLALDLLLNEIVEQARLATTATGAAIALVRDDEMVCRATTGANAPGLGDRLSTRSGLSGACVQTRRVQRCDDTEIDHRVDAASLRGLEVRSILAVPVLSGEALVGVFQIFSPRPNAFSDRDIQTVQALSRRIVDNLRRAAEASAGPASTISSSSAVPSADQNTAILPAAQIVSQGTRKKHQPRDHWTDILNATVIGLALLLGWMLGRAEWQRVTGAGGKQPANTSPSQRPEAAAAQVPIASQTGATSTQGTGEKGSDDAGSKQSNIKSRPKGSPASDLVVYENGKVVFRMTPAQKSSQKNTGSGSNPDATTNETEQGVGGVTAVSPEIANNYLIRRVEPQYPESARRQNIQGPVTLSAVVDEDGSVRSVTVLSGDSALAPAALEAVRQWRFKPYRVNGRAAEFTTRITVNFRLP